MGSSLRLGFHYHVPARKNQAGKIYMPGSLGRFVDSLAEQCETVVCFQHSPLPQEMAFMDYAVQSANVTWVDLGPHVSLPRRLIRLPQLMRPFYNWRDELDALLVRAPTPLLPFVPFAVGRLPIALLLIGKKADRRDLIVPQPRWRKELLLRWALWYTRRERQIAKRSLAFVNGRQLYDELEPIVPDLVETRTTTLGANDFFERKDTCSNPPYHLLYVGRMTRLKGLLEMVEALSILVAEGEDVVLDLVGPLEKGDDVLEELSAFAQHRAVSDRVIYHGYKKLGPELLAYYRAADTFVIASKGESFPRTIWEAMAHSLPVVATRVGSIPHVLTDMETAVLVDPGNSVQLAQALKQLMTDSALRQRLIRQGMTLARGNTLEKRACEMVEQIEQWLVQRKSKSEC